MSGPGEAPQALTPTLRQAARRARFWVVAVLIALATALVSLLVVGTTAGGDAFASTNPAPVGGQGLAEVLRRQGVTVTAAGTLAEATAAAADPAGSTLLVFDPNGYLRADQLSTVGRLASRLVLVQPSSAALERLAPGVSLAGFPGAATALPAGCALPAAVRAGTLSVGGSSFTLPAGAGAAGPAESPAPSGSTVGCFPGEFGTVQLVQTRSAAGTVTALADYAPFSNERIVENGNAALALALLGETPRLVWYLPSVRDLPATGPPSIADLTPEWLTPTILLLLVGAVAAAVWRGRRLGPLVVENLPVIVPARETMEGRARLYARASARTRALDALRIGAVGRLAGALGLPRSATVPEVAAASASLTGRALHEVSAILLTELPGTDRDLIRLSDALAELERAVHAELNGRMGR